MWCSPGSPWRKNRTYCGERNSKPGRHVCLPANELTKPQHDGFMPSENLMCRVGSCLTVCMFQASMEEKCTESVKGPKTLIVQTGRSFCILTHSMSPMKNASPMWRRILVREVCTCAAGWLLILWELPLVPEIFQRVLHGSHLCQR